MTARFTGRHMLAIMLAFFGVVIAVTVMMARAAIGTFGGEVVDNSYVASQRYDDWLNAAARQKALGWHVVPGVDARRVLHVVATDASGQPLGGQVVVILRHPLGAMPDRRIELQSIGADRVAPQPLGAGRWLLHIEVSAHGHIARFEDEVRA